MICEHFIHIGLGDTGEGIIRYALSSRLSKMGRVKWIDDRAHLALRTAYEILYEQGFEEYPPSFTFIRNPRDWYISYYIHELKMRRYAGTFRNFVLTHPASQMYISEKLGRGVIEWPPSPGVRMWDFWAVMTKPGPSYVGRFENFHEDFANIMIRVCPGLERGEVDSWFPQIYGAWSGRPWIECIEQWLADELWTSDLWEMIHEWDAPIFEKWGYTLEGKYEFS